MFENENLPEQEAVSEVSEATIETIETVEKQEPPRDHIKEWKQSEQKNFAALRQKAEAAERERDVALKRLQDIEQQAEEFTLGPDDIAEGKHLKKIHQKVSNEIKNLKEEINEYKKQAQNVATEARIKSNYHDFDAVVTSASLAALRDSHPELLSTIQSAPDLYAQAVSAYTMIKQLGLVEDPQQSRDQSRAKDNLNKPRPASSVGPQQGESPLSRANAFADGLTEDLKSQLRKEMYGAMKNY